MKVCSLCKKEKEIVLFKKDNKRADGISSHCKECARIRCLEYYYKTKESRSEKIKESNKRNKMNNDYSEYRKDYYVNNKEKVKEGKKIYYSNNKEKSNEYAKNYYNNRIKYDNLYKIKHQVRSIISKSFNKNGFTKTSKTQEMLGCSFEEFKLHLESLFETWMTWENRGLYNGELNYGWDIDHKIPLASAETEEDLIRLNHYTNLQPLCGYTNRHIKSDNY